MPSPPTTAPRPGTPLNSARARGSRAGDGEAGGTAGDAPAGGAGVAALEQREPVGVETPFRVASVTKLFTASLAALCLDLDEPLPVGASPRRLLSHTAGLRPERARASLRFSLGKQNTTEDIEFALSVLPQEVARLRELSPAYKKQDAAVRTAGKLQ